ncbi:MAG: isochorismatase family protein [Syntrophomonadaceae bacterium]
MEKFFIKRQNTVLVIIDLQEKLLAAMNERNIVCNNTRLLLEAAHLFDIPVVITEQYPKGLGPTVQEIKEVLPEKYYFIEKTAFSAYTEEMQQTLSSIGKNTVIVTGSETHVCVFQTVRHLLEADYNVHVALDAVCSRFSVNYHNGLDLMKEMGAVINNTETILFDLLQRSGTPEFKKISPLLK